MGRELKRVPLDFAHPLNTVWPGYLNPHYVAVACAHCGGTGSSPEALHLKAQWYGNGAAFRPEDRGSKPFTADHPAVLRCAARNVAHAPEYYGSGELAIQQESGRLAAYFNRGWCHHLNAADIAALIEADRLHDFTSEFQPGTGWVKRDPIPEITPEQVNAWSLSGFGHDSINQWIVVEAECKRRGFAYSCAHCDGQGDLWPSAEAEALYEAWSRSEPPTGEGFQIWETVSEGSPISPVFATPEELALHMAATSWGADKGTPYATWLKFIQGPGWAPSLIADDLGVRTGVQAA
ncbi:hypothetical protein SAMN05518669_103403 [Variovorax sp. YR634]|uniref:hypothetical protein n=1 Tax=Variovorax sp. YR634 TaxID=1884385 RepID=UPI000899CDCD|nr:hypothetical protein [Variovorax sp. YR634]SDX14836.1 hypothetical protein SAMN05518669_103403 [Variovorax sp. YR634]